MPQATLPTFGSGASLDPSAGPFGKLAVGQGSGNLGLEPTVYLDEKKRFLDHLNEIRRLSIGPDQSDSAGYGLYLMRLPVSITPGECTYQGHGADLSVTVEHEFGKAFLPSTIRNLVVNDLVAQLGPVIYEVIRNGTLDKIDKAQAQVTALEAELATKRKERSQVIKELVADLLAKVRVVIDARKAVRIKQKQKELRANKQQEPPGLATRYEPTDANFAFGFLPVPAKLFAHFITRVPAQGQCPVASPTDPTIPAAVADRLETLHRALKELRRVKSDIADNLDPFIQDLETKIPKVRGGDLTAVSDDETVGNIQLAVSLLLSNAYVVQDGQLPNCPAILSDFYGALYESALQDDVGMLDAATGADPTQQKQITKPLAAGKVQLSELTAQLVTNKRDILDLVSRSLPSTRNPKQSYPISSREIPDFFLRNNLILLAEDAQRAMLTKTPRATEVRNYLRQTLYIAFDAMSKPVDDGTQPPLLDQMLMDQILQAVLGRKFGEGQDEPNSPLHSLQNVLFTNLQQSQANIARRPIGALCWAVAIDTVLLDQALREDVHKVLSDKGANCPDVSGLRFYIPTTEEVHTIFQEYVRLKWPILTFALDPVVDQQNLADSANLKRDLQLAVAFAFSTGQINFNQANSFRRQIEQQSDTIALNRTVVAYAHGESMFGFRFAPRFQNPPNERTNFGVIAHQLISGGPGPDYGTKKSKLEPGIRELTAVLLVPEFLQTVRLETAGNWFRLTDPEHLVIPTPRMLEQSRKVQELKQSVGQACNAQNYRLGDLRNLEAKIKNLDAMLPLQTRVVSLPFENQATGFELFSEGESAMVPELAGFEGVDTVPTDKQVSLFIFGRYFSIHETRVIVSGLPLTPSGPTTTQGNTSQSTTQTSTPGQFDVVSREVLQVNILANGLPTVTIDGKSYLELRVATPAGISNAVLIPVKSADSSASKIAFDLNSDSQELDVFYQWSKSNLGEAAAGSAGRDGALIRTAQAGPGLPMQLPGPISNLFSGSQPPLPAPLTSPAIPTALTPAGAQQALVSLGQALAADGSRQASAVPGSNQPTQPQLPPIVMAPSQVVVVPSPPATKARSHSRLLRFLDHSRNNQAAAPGQ